MGSAAPPPTTGLCGYVYAALPKGYIGDSGEPRLVWTGAADILASAISAYSVAPWSVVASGTYDCAGPVPSLPPPEVTSPPPPQLPPSEQPPPETPPEAPPDPGGQDSISILIQLIEQLIIVTRNPPPRPGPQPGPSEACCEQVTLAINNVALAIAGIAKQIQPPQGGGPPPQIDPVTCTQLTALTAQLVTAIREIPPAAPADLSEVVHQLKRGVDLDEAFTPTPEAYKAMMDRLLEEGVISPELGQILGDRIRPMIDPTRIHPTVRKLLGPKDDERSYAVRIVLSILSAMLKLVGIDIEPEIKLLATDMGAAMEGIWRKMLAKFEQVTGSMAGFLTPLARAGLDSVEAVIARSGGVTPDNAIDVGFAALGEAFLIGQSVHLLSALAGYIGYPVSSLFSLNAAAAVQLTGYEEIAKQLQGHFYDAAFGHSAMLHFRSKYKPEYPVEGDAVRWHSRGLLTDPEMAEIFQVSGLKQKYETAFITSAYRALSPFMFIRALESGVVSDTDAREAMTFTGMRKRDQETMIVVAAELQLAPFRQKLIAAIELAAERGTIPMAQLDDDLRSAGVTPEAFGLIRQQIAYRRLEQLAELYRKSVSEAYRFGLISDADYVPHLEAIGIGEADAQAHYAIDSFARRGHALAEERREAARAAATLERVSVQAALEEYRAGRIDAAALAAALLAAGMAPVMVPFAVAIAEARRDGRMVTLYGRRLSVADAALLREEVTVIAHQAREGLISLAEAHSALATRDIPAANADALIALWAATRTKKAGGPVELPL